MSTHVRSSIYGQRHAKRDIQTCAKSVDPDQPLRLRRSVWSGSALFDTRHINSIYFSCCVNILIAYMCFQHRIQADLGLHYMLYPKVSFRVTLAILYLNFNDNILHILKNASLSDTVLVLIKLTKFAVALRLRCGSCKLIF